MNTKKVPMYGYDKTKLIYGTSDGLRSLTFVIYRNLPVTGEIYLNIGSKPPLKFFLDIAEMKKLAQEGLIRIAKGNKEVSILAPDLSPFALDESDLQFLNLLVNDSYGFEKKVSKLNIKVRG